MTDAPARRGLLHVLQEIWHRQEAQGFKGRSKEEIDADIQAMRDEWEERQLAIEKLQEESWAAARQGSKDKSS